MSGRSTCPDARAPTVRLQVHEAGLSPTLVLLAARHVIARLCSVVPAETRALSLVVLWLSGQHIGVLGVRTRSEKHFLSFDKVS